MNILLVYNHFCVSSGRYMTDAFKRVGHNVRHIGPAHGRDIWGMQVDAKYVHEPDTINPESGYWPDLIVVMDSDPHILDMYNRRDEFSHNPPLVVYGVDNHVRDYRRPWFDHYFLAHRGVSVMDWWAGGFDFCDTLVGIPKTDMTWLPCAYDPTIFTPSPIPYAEREWDVCMIGVMYPQRWALVNALKAAGLKVYAGTGLLFEDYAAAYHNARISLCVSAAGDVAQRVFETAAMGCLVVSDECADFERLRVDGIVAAPQGTLAEQVIHLAKSPDANDPDGYIQRAIQRSMTWVRPNSWDARAQVMIDWLEKRQAGEVTHEAL